ncbi:SDR family NAD(P)-dependent oxidoreductase [Zhongshania aquimaris]|uniref:SDR family oxidoreductase n=1 Tax=Zhongshania aquimaris TaxID=2857107 RepID=A0ABS6VW14_9GAMM|nr:SDR family oxidoreductase [Zhongshania aquimaris]MBW2942529.1 SDR family oxidoreductase [Zhongshania aquimaris]
MNSLSSMFGLEGRLAVVTGGASGIGAGIASALAAAGARVIIADINIDAAQAFANSMPAADIQVIKLDLADEENVLSVSEDILKNFGTPWVLVNNAGLQDRQAFFESTTAEWDRMVAVNSRGPFILSRELSRAMASVGGGRIVNIASAALRGSIVKGLVAYTASKGALLAQSSALAFELAEFGITVNTVLPGGVATPGAIAAKGPVPEGPARRPAPLGMCKPEDIAAAVLYFSAPAAQRVTNQVIAVDGGFSVS